MIDTSQKKLIPAGLLALFLLYYLRPYYGIRHDGALYLGQALLRLDPGNLSSDLFFKYGSQADFTVFPYFVASLLRHFDAASVFLVMTVSSLALFWWPVPAFWLDFSLLANGIGASWPC